MSVDLGEKRVAEKADAVAIQAANDKLAADKTTPVAHRAWKALWPKGLAVAIVLGIWQLVYELEWRPAYLFASPGETFSRLGDLMTGDVPLVDFWGGVATTLQRGVLGFLAALVVGTLLGIAVSQWSVLRSAIGSMISGLQTMPSIAWFPFAIMVYGLSEKAIYFVILMGAVPSIANGIISGIDDVPPSYLRAGHMLGARGINRYRYVILPAAFPSYVAGLTQGWAFAWRGLLAGELLVQIPSIPAMGTQLHNAGQSGKSASLLAMMIVILIVGMVADFVFSSTAKHVRAKRGLTGFKAQR